MAVKSRMIKIEIVYLLDNKQGEATECRFSIETALCVYEVMYLTQ
jgi:hypothetical protein